MDEIVYLHCHQQREYSENIWYFLDFFHKNNVKLNRKLRLLWYMIFVADMGGTIVMVGQDGVQRPPIHFPKGGHLLAFLSCMENGLLPHGQLDPPLWTQRGKGMHG